MFHRHIHRTYVPDGVYFVTTYVRGRMQFFRNPHVAKIVMQSMRWKRSSQYVLYAYVVMPDHLHLLIQPTKGSISTIMQSLKSNTTREINRYISHAHNGERALAVMQREKRFQWQKSFYDHVITNDNDFRNHIEYIRYNPVKARLCDKPESYPFLHINYDAIQSLFGHAILPRQ